MTHVLAVGTLLAVLAVSPSSPPADPEGPTVRLVYLGSSTCGPCRAPEVKQAIAAARDAARGWAREHRHDFVFTGVATDPDIGRGWQFLSENGSFDEVIIGRGWLNLGITTFVTPYPDDPLAALGMPQLVVLVEDRRFEGAKVRTVRAPVVVFRSLGSLIPRHATAENLRAALDEASKENP